MNSTKRKPPAIDPITVIVIIILIIIYCISFGGVDFGKSRFSPSEFREGKEQAKVRHHKLSELLRKQEDLFAKLQKVFKRTYFFVRLGLISIWLFTLFLLHLYGFLKDLDDALTYSEAAIIALIAINFLTFGSISNLHSFEHFVRTKTENLIMGKYVNLESKIDKTKSQIEHTKSRM